jgi:hypothetical protein
MRRVRVGCSGWSYDDWRGGLYPDGLPQRRWLERYAEVFDTVEVNATFYRLPKRSTVEEWVDQVPGDFLFAVKASRYLTHMKRLHEITDAVARFWEPLEPLRARRLATPDRRLALTPSGLRRSQQRLEGLRPRQRPLPDAWPCPRRRGVRGRHGLRSEPRRRVRARQPLARPSCARPPPSVAAAFVGPAGSVLARALESAGIDAEDVYLTNAVKHFKWRPRGKRRLHQTPRAGEVEACRPWLDAELTGRPGGRPAAACVFSGEAWMSWASVFGSR